MVQAVAVSNLGGGICFFFICLFFKIIFLQFTLNFSFQANSYLMCSVFFMNPIPEYRHIMNKEPMDYLVTSYSLILAASNHFI